jgi:cell wall-associated NlpC family hydrolase
VIDNGAEVLQVETEDYPYDGRFYIDKRLVEPAKYGAIPPKILPPPAQILAKLQTIASEDKKRNIIYVWGGNFRKGLPYLQKFYPKKIKLDAYNEDYYIYRGLDCSGLLYEAANAATPRNTSELLEFGDEVEVENKTADEIASLVKPLDLIVWPGHVIIVLDKNNVIESSQETGGVQVSNLTTRLVSVMNTHKPRNSAASGKDWFMVRRFV